MIPAYQKHQQIFVIQKLTQKCFIDAFEKITIGLPKQVDNRPKENIRMVAYHEAGHAIGALFFNEMYDLRRPFKDDGSWDPVNNPEHAGIQNKINELHGADKRY